jgi:putative peptidoglycan lipid II flippase
MMASGRARAAVRATALLFTLSLTSRVLGLVREATVAARFGASGEMDAFFVAFRIPDLLLNSLLTFLVATSFIPIFAEFEARGDERGAGAFTASVAGMLALTLCGVALLLSLVAPWLVPTIAPGLPPARARLAVELTRVMLPALVFAGLAGVARSALNARGRFLVPALIPYVFNVTIITTVVALGARLGVGALALGILLASVLQWLVHLPSLRTAGIPLRPTLHGDRAGLRRFGMLLAPVVVALLAGQVVPLAEVYLASHERAGAISYLGFAQRIFSMPEQLFSTTVATVLVPFLAIDVAAGRGSVAGEQLARAIRILLFLTLPVGVLLAVLARPVVALLLGRGAFDAAAVEGTTAALTVYALGLSAVCIRALAVAAFFAFQDTRTLLWVTLAMAAVNIGLDIVLVRHLSYVGIALGATLTAVLHMGTLVALLPRHCGPIPVFREGADLLKSAASAALMALVVVGILAALPFGGTAAQRLLLLAVGGVGGIGVYAAGALLFRVRDGRSAWALLRQAVRRRG